MVALERAADLRLGRTLGQSVSYVMVDDTKDSRERVMLASEGLSEYDVGLYRELVVRAAARGYRRLDGVNRILRRS